MYVQGSGMKMDWNKEDAHPSEKRDGDPGSIHKN
jgi:hypothetical protein